MVDEAKKREAAQWVQMGVASLKTKDVAQARKCLLQALSLDPENIEALLWLTNTTGDPLERRKILRRAVSIAPNHPQARRALAKIEEQLGEAPEDAAPPPAAAPQPPPPAKPSEPLPQVTAPVPLASPEIEVGRQEASRPEVTVPAPTPSDEGPHSLLDRLGGGQPAAPVQTVEPLQDESLTDAIADQPEEEGDLVDDFALGDRLSSMFTTPQVPQPPREEVRSRPASPAPFMGEGGDQANEAPAVNIEELLEAPTLDDFHPTVADPTVLPAQEIGPPMTVEDAERDADLEALEQAHSAPAEDAGRCPRCGAVMRARPGSGAPYCVFCGYGMEDEGRATLQAARLHPERPWPDAARSRHCLTCDAIIVPPAGPTVEMLCPLCRQAVFDVERVALALPDAYLPFKITEAEAAIALEDAAKRGGVGRLLRGRTEMSRPRAAYLPVWLFDGVGQARYEFTGQPGQGGSHTEMYRLVPVHAVPQIDGGLLRLASEGEVKGAPAYDPAAGRELFVLLPNVALQAAITEARTLMLRDTRQKTHDNVQAPAPREGQKPISKRAPAVIPGSVAVTQSDVEELAYQLMLFPVWINEVRDGNRVRMGMANGSTGRAAVGEPVRRRQKR